MSNSITPTKTCTKCDKTFPATTEFFYSYKRGLLGLRSYCKKCWAEQNRQYVADNTEKIIEQNRKYVASNREKVAARKKRWHEINRQKLSEKKRQSYQANKESIKLKRRQYYKDNREKIVERVRKYYILNRKAFLEKARRYRENNPEKMRQWATANPDRIRVNINRRRARKLSLPDTFTVEQWERSVDYFYGCCAVCAAQLIDLFGLIKPHADHWIAISHPDCPGTIATNMLPLCSRCNLSKHDKMPEQWLTQTFGTRKAKQILVRIETYFEWVREQDSFS